MEFSTPSNRILLPETVIAGTPVPPVDEPLEELLEELLLEELLEEELLEELLEDEPESPLPEPPPQAEMLIANNAVKPNFTNI